MESTRSLRTGAPGPLRSRRQAWCRGFIVLLLGMFALPIGVTARQPAPSMVVVTAVDDNGEPVPGACFALDDGRSVFPIFRGCDGDDGAPDGTTTLYAIDPVNTQVSPGDYVLVEVTAPEGFRVGIRKAIVVEEGQTLEVRIKQRTGGRSLRVAQVDEAGKPLPGGCILLSRERTLGQPGELVAIRCDADGGEDGTIGIAGLLAGSYLVLDFGSPPGYVGLDQGYSVATVAKNRDASLTLAYALSGEGTIAIVDADGQPVKGLCLQVTLEATGPGRLYVCDEFDRGGLDGTIEVRSLRAGKHQILITAVPRGMRPPSKPKTITITPGEPAVVTVTLAAGGQGIVVTTLDPDGKSARGGCFSLYPEGADPKLTNSLVRGCDQEDGKQDGITVVSAPPGSYLLVGGGGRFGRAPDQTVTVRRNRETEVTITYDPVGAVTLTLADEDGKAVPGVCFQAVEATGSPPYRSVALNCDSYGPNADGVVTLRGLPNGDVIVFAIDLPRGYQLPASLTVTVEVEQRAELTMTTAKGGEELAIHAVDAEDRPVVGPCFQVLAVTTALAASIVTEVCAVYDGSVDGTATVLGLPAGEYQLVQVRAPEGYGLADAVEVMVKADTVNEATMTVPVVS